MTAATKKPIKQQRQSCHPGLSHLNSTAMLRGLAGEGGKSSLTALCGNNVVAKGSKDCPDGLSASDICWLVLLQHPITQVWEGTCSRWNLVQGHLNWGRNQTPPPSLSTPWDSMGPQLSKPRLLYLENRVYKTPKPGVLASSPNSRWAHLNIMRKNSSLHTIMYQVSYTTLAKSTRRPSNLISRRVSFYIILTI